VGAGVGSVLSLAVGGARRILNGYQSLVEQQSLYLSGGGKAWLLGLSIVEGGGGQWWWW
jgi:hypothetical protein